MLGYCFVASRPRRENMLTLPCWMKVSARTPSSLGSKNQSADEKSPSESEAFIGSIQRGNDAGRVPARSPGRRHISATVRRSGKRPALMSSRLRPESTDLSSSVTSRSVSANRSLCFISSHSLAARLVRTSVQEPFSLCPRRNTEIFPSSIPSRMRASASSRSSNESLPPSSGE